MTSKYAARSNHSELVFELKLQQKELRYSNRYQGKIAVSVQSWLDKLFEISRSRRVNTHAMVSPRSMCHETARLLMGGGEGTKGHKQTEKEVT